MWGPRSWGARGGLLTGEHGCVLRDGMVAGGMYAAGNTTASVMGWTCPGPALGTGPAATFACLAVRYAVS